MTKVAIIVPVYMMKEKKRQLLSMIESIEKQTYINWELVICDDGSTDGTYEILNKLVGHKGNVTILRNVTNRFAAATRNFCILSTNAEYIAIQDADDYSDPDRITHQVDFLDTHLEYAFVSSQAYLIKNDKVIGISGAIEKPRRKDFIKDMPFCHASTMFRRTALLSVGCYNEKIRYGEDYDLFMRLYAAGFQGFSIQKPFYYYRIDDAFQKMKFKEYLNLSKIRLNGFRNMKVLKKGFFYVFKPIISFLIPALFLKILRNRRWIKNGTQN